MFLTCFTFGDKSKKMQEIFSPSAQQEYFLPTISVHWLAFPVPRGERGGSLDFPGSPRARAFLAWPQPGGISLLWRSDLLQFLRACKTVLRLLVEAMDIPDSILDSPAGSAHLVAAMHPLL